MDQNSYAGFIDYRLDRHMDDDAVTRSKLSKVLSGLNSTFLRDLSCIHRYKSSKQNDDVN